MRRALVVVVLLACSSKKEQGADHAPAAGSAVGSAVADAKLVDRWFVAMEKQLDADARAVAVQKFASREEVEQAMMSLTPAGFRPRPEFFQAIFDEAGPPATLAQRLADYARTHGDDMERRADEMLQRLEPVLKQAADNAQRQFAR